MGTTVNRKRIQSGDEVLCIVNNEISVQGTCLYIPCATGDSWIIEEPGRGVVYVQNFLLIQLLKKGE